MGFLSSRNINWIAVHASFIRLIDMMAWTFGPVFFYRIGISVPYIFLLAASINLLRIPFRFLVIPLVQKTGLKNTLILSTIFYGLKLLLLVQVAKPDIYLAIYILISALSSALYWVSFHSFYTLSGNPDHRGKHYALMQAAKLGIIALAPYLSGVFIEFHNFTEFFYFAIPLMIGALIPVIMCRNIEIQFSKKEWKKEFLTFGGKSHFMDILTEDTQSLCWLFMVFFALGNISYFGAIFTIGLIAQAGVQLLLGHFMDRGYLWKIFIFGSIMIAVAIIAMATTHLSFITAALLDAFFSIALMSQGSGFAVSLYNDAHRSKQILWYWLFSEFWVDVASILTRVAEAALLLADVPLNIILTISLSGIAGLYIVMKNHHKKAF